MEGTGSFGAGLRFLADYGLTVIEVKIPIRTATCNLPLPLMLRTGAKGR